MSKLILMVGLPRSGKTTRARKLSSDLNAPMVSPDAVRKIVCGRAYHQNAEPLVWGVVKTMVQSLFEAGHGTVIVDACNNTKARRDEWKFGHWKIEIQVVTTPASVCRQRAIDSCSDPNLLEVIDRMAAFHEPPEKDEGLLTNTAGF